MSEKRFLILLFAFLLLMVAAPAISLVQSPKYPVIASISMSASFAVILLAAAYAVSERPGQWVLSGILAVLTISLLAAGRFLANNETLACGHAAGILFLIYVLVLILKHVFEAKKVTTDTICASLCAYLTFGVLYAIVYSFFELLMPGSFSPGPAGNGESGALVFGGEQTYRVLYFSYVTLTTLGYGDITPLSPVTRMLSVTESILGQIYLAVLVARLVGLHIVHQQNDKQE